MSTAEIKEAIHSKVDKLPDAALLEILSFIDKVQEKQYIDKDRFDEHVKNIIADNRELLQRLAE